MKKLLVVLVLLSLPVMATEVVPNQERNIVVTHMVNPKGIQTLSAHYDKVFFTNSYKDWENEELPINVSVLKV